MINPILKEGALKMYLEKYADEDVQKMTRKFELEESERCFWTDENNEPNKFNFTIESCGIIPPESILLTGLIELKKKIISFKSDLDDHISKKQGNINIKESDCIMKSYDIVIENAELLIKEVEPLLRR